MYRQGTHADQWWTCHWFDIQYETSERSPRGLKVMIVGMNHDVNQKLSSYTEVALMTLSSQHFMEVDSWFYCVGHCLSHGTYRTICQNQRECFNTWWDATNVKLWLCFLLKIPIVFGSVCKYGAMKAWINNHVCIRAAEQPIKLTRFGKNKKRNQPTCPFEATVQPPTRIILQGFALFRYINYVGSWKKLFS